MRRASAPSFGSAAGRVVDRLLRDLESPLRLLGRLDGAEHGALQPRGLLLEGQELLRVLRLQRLQAERLDLERPRLAERREGAVHPLLERDGVGPGHGERPGGRVVEGVLDGGGAGLEGRRVRGREAQVPGHAVDAGLHGAGEPADDVAVGVLHGEDDRGVLLARLGAQRGRRPGTRSSAPFFSASFSASSRAFRFVFTSSFR